MLSDAAVGRAAEDARGAAGHVVFVLATTDPQKVIADHPQPHAALRVPPAARGTARASYVRYVVADAGLDVASDAVDVAVRAGRRLGPRHAVGARPGGRGRRRGRARRCRSTSSSRRSPSATPAGRWSRWPTRSTPAAILGCSREQLVARLRDVFLVAMKAPLDHLSDADRAASTTAHRAVRAPPVTRGPSRCSARRWSTMLDAVDHRIVLDAALVRLANAEADTSPAALLERIERLEAALAAGGSPPRRDRRRPLRRPQRGTTRRRARAGCCANAAVDAAAGARAAQARTADPTATPAAASAPSPPATCRAATGDAAVPRRAHLGLGRHAAVARFRGRRAALRRRTVRRRRRAAARCSPCRTRRTGRRCEEHPGRGRAVLADALRPARPVGHS